jgi:uncharacterized protein YyaL (SSP411 family)
MLPVDPSRQQRLAALLPWVESMGMRDGQATAYVCRDFACQAPATDPNIFTTQL